MGAFTLRGSQTGGGRSLSPSVFFYSGTSDTLGTFPAHLARSWTRPAADLSTRPLCTSWHATFFGGLGCCGALSVRDRAPKRCFRALRGKEVVVCSLMKKNTKSFRFICLNGLEVLFSRSSFDSIPHQRTSFSLLIYSPPQAASMMSSTIIVSRPPSWLVRSGCSEFWGSSSSSGSSGTSTMVAALE